MSALSFDTALAGRIEHILDACTRCGKCVEVCPITEAAQLPPASPENIVTGVLDILRSGDGPEAARKWASSCVLSGECIKACDYGINPRFMLAMARVSMVKAKNEPPQTRRRGVQDFRTLNQDVTILSRMQLTGDMLERLGQKTAKPTDPTSEDTKSDAPDFVFYTGCNVLKTPHIALLCLDIMDALGAHYRVMGGRAIAAASCSCAPATPKPPGALPPTRSTSCRNRSPARFSRGVRAAMCSSQRSRSHDRAHARRPPVRNDAVHALSHSHRERLRPLLRERWHARCAASSPGVAGVVEAAETILQSIPASHWSISSNRRSVDEQRAARAS